MRFKIVVFSEPAMQESDSQSNSSWVIAVTVELPLYNWDRKEMRMIRLRGNIMPCPSSKGEIRIDKNKLMPFFYL